MLRFLWPSGSPLHRLSSSPDSWALVTGSSDGIGKAFATELAVEYGFNVVIHGRNRTKLDAVREEILAEHCAKHAGKKVEIKIIVADTARAQELDYGALFVQPLSHLRLTLLINNVGVSHGPDTEAFSSLTGEISDADALTIINTNNVFLTMLTKHVLPLLVAHKPALIVNISSHASVFPMPFISVYSASKAFINAFSTSLDMELSMEPHTRGVACQSLMVGSVQSNSSKAKAGLMRPTAKDFVGQACKVLGDGTRVGAGCFAHALQLFLMGWLPSWVANLLATTVAAKLRKETKKDA